MNKRVIVQRATLAAVCFILAAGSGRADDGGRGEIAGGYSYLRVDACSAETCVGNTAETLSRGWFGSGAISIGRSLWATGELSGSYRTTTDEAGGATATASLKLHSIVGGPRYARTRGGATVFAQFLIGVTRASGSVNASGPGLAVDIAAAQNDFCYEPGGGLDIGLSTRAALRVGANVRFVRASGSTSKELQVVAGLVYRLGKERN